MKSTSKKYHSFLRSMSIASLVLILGISGILLYSTLPSAHVLGARTANSNDEGVTTVTSHSSEQPEKVEPTEVAEPTEIPEPSEAPEVKEQVEQVNQEVRQQTGNHNLQSVEIHPPQEGSNSGKVVLVQKGNITKEMQTPASSQTAITNINTKNAGILGVHIQGKNTIAINNGPYTITTQYPVVINPKDQTMSIKTPNGDIIVTAFPTEIFQSLPQKDKFSSVSSVNLTQQQGTPVYEAQGTQIRKLLGVIPVNGTVRERINAQTGQVMQSNLPWYYSLFGFAFQST